MTILENGYALRLEPVFKNNQLTSWRAIVFAVESGNPDYQSVTYIVETKQPNQLTWLCQHVDEIFDFVYVAHNDKLYRPIAPMTVLEISRLFAEDMAKITK